MLLAIRSSVIVPRISRVLRFRLSFLLRFALSGMPRTPLCLVTILIVTSTGTAAPLPSSGGAHAFRNPDARDPRARPPKPLFRGPMNGIATPCGFYLLATMVPSPLMVLVPGRNIQFLPHARPEYSVVDELPLDATIALESEMGLKPGRFRGLDLLKEHQRWEQTWLAKVHGRSSTAIQEITSSESGPAAWHIWLYSFPKPVPVLGTPAASLLYLTIAGESGVLALCAVLRQRNDEPRAQRIFEKAARTIERFSSAADLALIAKQIQSAARQTTTCSDFAALLRSA